MQQFRMSFISLVYLYTFMCSTANSSIANENENPVSAFLCACVWNVILLRLLSIGKFLMCAP